MFSEFNAVLGASEVFRMVSPAALADLISMMGLKQVSAGERLLSAGAPDQNLYLLLSGELRLLGRDHAGGEFILLGAGKKKKVLIFVIS